MKDLEEQLRKLNLETYPRKKNLQNQKKTTLVLSNSNSCTLKKIKLEHDK